MKRLENLLKRIRKLMDAAYRFPLTAFFLLSAVIINAININNQKDVYIKYLITLSIGAILGAVAQVIYERFFNNYIIKGIFMSGAVLLTLGYYSIIHSELRLHLELEIRTIVAVFALLIAFIWIPSIRSKFTFNESFMAAFKAFFIALFFSGIIFVGSSIIIATINQLLFTVNEKVYAHTANIVFLLFAPMYFFSLIPIFPGKIDELTKNLSKSNLRSMVIASKAGTPHSVKEKNIINNQKMQTIAKAVACPKYVEILLSYIIIPLTGIFTIILLLYIVRNIRGKFWTNSLLEPMIVIYSITVILLYILTSTFKNKLAELFRKVEPKILVPIVLFQTIASFIKIDEYGITHTRYFVIIYGIFALVAGILFCFLSVKRNGIIAALLILFSVISIIPPIDAFTISYFSQEKVLKKVLSENSMFENNTIIPKADITEESKQKIIKSVNYLSMMEYTNRIQWMPRNFNYYDDFNKTFGFYPNEQIEGKEPFLYMSLPQNTPIDITGYDYMVFTSTEIANNNTVNEVIGSFEKAGKKYKLYKIISSDETSIKVMDDKDQAVIVFNIMDVFKKFKNYSSKGLLTIDEATFITENDIVSMKLVMQNINLNWSENQEYYMADMYVLVGIK